MAHESTDGLGKGPGGIVMFRDVRVLVAGGAGFVGTNLILRLKSLGARVRATIHESPPKVEMPDVEFLQADLTRPDDNRRAVEGMDYVFMCAANTSGAAVMTQTPLAHVTPNVLMNTLLMEAAYEAKVKKYVFLSSSAAYPESGDRAVREEEMFGGDPPEVYYSVGWMKRYAEILCRVYAEKIKNSMPAVVVRPSNIYGPNDKYDFGKSHVTAALLRRVVERHDPLEVWGTGDDVRDLIYIDDFLDGLLLAVEKTERFMAVNIASGKGYSIKEVLKTLIEIDGFTGADVRFDASKPQTIPIRMINTSLAEKRLGFKCRVSLEEGLRRTLAWYRLHHEPPSS